MISLACFIVLYSNKDNLSCLYIISQSRFADPLTTKKTSVSFSLAIQVIIIRSCFTKHYKTHVMNHRFIFLFIKL